MTGGRAACVGVFAQTMAAKRQPGLMAAGRWMTGGQAWVSTWEVRHLGMWVTTRALRARWRGAAGWQVGLSFQRFKLLYIYVYAVAVPRMG